MSDHLRAHDAALERLRLLHPIKIDLSLDRISRLLDALGRPQDRLPPTIHVAGTNGKGSTSAFIRAIGEAAGLRVHVLTSPHLVRFVERIRLAGTLITEDHLADILARVEAANAGLPITFFEIVTAAAFLAFAETPADLLVLEVGLGGRFDATNVVAAPAVSVICPVDYDHKEFLGEDLAGIAGEKAGIIKRGRPVVCARQAEVAEAVIERQALALAAPLSRMGVDFDAWTERGRLIFQHEAGLMDLPAPSLIGPHQVDNAGLAIAATLALNDPRIDEGAIARAVASADWPARMQRLTLGPYGKAAAGYGADLWLDGGHNPHGARAIARTLQDLARDGRPVTLIAGTLANKDAEGFFAALAEPGVVSRVIAVTFDAEAAAPAKRTAEAAARAGLKAEVAESMPDAVQRALQGPPPHVLICGSLYLAGEVLAASEETWPT
ncbi:MAG TPA: folylpolyglutamate synthase/dihydrofolate synthase family protein [Caulobacteraceae bacterium]|nr:folylpolyglutamate synthase/dihydrofolate synthase family protein [Caulobacteraceae bacterium]